MIKLFNRVSDEDKVRKKKIQFRGFNKVKLY
jgi:hypothetical protein